MRRDLRHGHINTHVGIEKNLDDAEPVQGLRFDVLDVVDRRGEPALEAHDEPLGNILGRKSCVPINDCDDRDIDVRENIDGRGIDRQSPQNQNEQRHHHKGVGSPQR